MDGHQGVNGAPVFVIGKFGVSCEKTRVRVAQPPSLRRQLRSESQGYEQIAKKLCKPMIEILYLACILRLSFLAMRGLYSIKYMKRMIACSAMH